MSSISEPSRQALSPGQVVDQRYSIVREIGKGGVGTVYLAYHMNLQQYVVLKQITRNVGELPPRHEVDILKRLNHPYLPRVYDYLSINNCIFTVMDYVEGIDLQKMIESRRACSTENVIRWFKELTEVLAYLEKNSVVHSDIKPGNIIITPENDAVLIDFNISLRMRTDSVVGASIEYASPEQIEEIQERLRGIQAESTLDTRSDIYSLGATFYELISYIKPNAIATITPLEALNTGFPDEFCRIIDTAMQKDRNDRFVSAAKMQHYLGTMWKRQKGYRLYLLAQSAAAIGAALVVALGVFFMVQGYREKIQLSFTNDYNSAMILLSDQNYLQTELACMNLLNKYDTYLEQNQARKADIYSALGEAYFFEGNYDSAIEYYDSALSLMGTEEFSNIAECYAGIVEAYLQEKDLDLAEYMLKKAKVNGVEANYLKLLEIEISMYRGDESAALEELEALKNNADHEITARACLVVAEQSTDEQTKINEYCASLAYIDEQKLYRRAGTGLLNICTSNFIPEHIDQADEAAIQCYLWLTAQSDASVNDFINLAVAYELGERYTEAIQTLEQLEESRYLNADEGLVSMYKAFIYDQKGDGTKASLMAQRALETLNAADVSDSDWSKLLRLGDE